MTGTSPGDRSRTRVEEEVRSVLAEALGLAPEEIAPAARLRALGAESLDLLTALTELEERLDGVRLPTDALSAESTVDDLVEELWRAWRAQA
ncbi:MAG: acyl carrier protein [Vicinamibacteria bacterium]|nr:acyl carrier protein [Vicinamibacteria bacterium]